MRGSVSTRKQTGSGTSDSCEPLSVTPPLVSSYTFDAPSCDAWNGVCMRTVTSSVTDRAPAASARLNAKSSTVITPSSSKPMSVGPSYR